MELLFLAFDHRSSFTQVVGSDKRKVRKAKLLVFRALLKAVSSKTPPKQSAAALVDPEYGTAVINQAKKAGVTLAIPVEKSGRKVFQFAEREWKARVKRINPSIVKALVRYNPTEDNSTQDKRLRQASEWCIAEGYPFMLEMLVPPTGKQKTPYYDVKLRPKLVLEAMKNLLAAGVRPAIWKIEGFDRQADADKAVALARKNRSSVIILGRAESIAQVIHWLAVGKKAGAIGFAVGRTIFLDALKKWAAGRMTEAQAVDEMARRYSKLSRAWEKAG